MTARAVRLSNWDERIARARALADSRPAAGEVLAFYAALAGFQKSLVDADELAPAEIRGPSSSPASFLGPIELERALNAIPRFLEWLPTAGPEPLIESMDTVRDFSRDEWADLAGSFSDTATRGSSLGSTDRVAVTEGVRQGFSPASIDDPLTLFVLEAVLQPFAERLARQRSVRSPLEGRAPLHCPRCGAPPVVAVLREEGHSAKRFLLCALCLTEWQCLRILCPACGEQAFERLPIFTAEQFTHVRVDACDRCRRYVKTIDLSKDGLAVPCVDDIASVSLDLWAREQEYTRLKRNVLGL